MQQASDFLEESEILAEALATLDHSDWGAPTQFKNWSFNDVLVHLHFWNRAADKAATNPAGSAGMWAEIGRGLASGSLRDFENAQITARGAPLFEAWQELFRDMGQRWQSFDPKMRVKWVGPDMSVRSSITARQMETWAHGQEVFDTLGLNRLESDRVKNVVVLGVNTYSWSFQVKGREAPGPMPHLSLKSPSGALWEFGESDGTNAISGSAVAFAQVVTQTRNIADTELSVEGPVALDWMKNAQCFAGPPENPPAPGTRGIK